MSFLLLAANLDLSPSLLPDARLDPMFAFSAHCTKPPRTDSTGEVDQNMALLDQKATVLGRCFEQPAPQTNSESLALTQGAYTTPQQFQNQAFSKKAFHSGCNTHHVPKSFHI